MTTYEVTVHAEGNMDETHVVSARDEWKARTAAMMFYVQPLRGNAVSYTVKEMG